MGELGGGKVEEGLEAEVGVVKGEGAEVIGEALACIWVRGEDGRECAEEVDVHAENLERKFFGWAGLDGV
jgi:hypothetical protein